MTKQGRINDKAGYVVLEHDRYGEWIMPPFPMVDSVGKAVDLIRTMQEARKGAALPNTYAVGRIELVMISRPEQVDQ